jgi:primary-amine oxidase
MKKLLLMSCWLLLPVVALAEHPLEPLSKDEISAAVAILKSAGKINDGSRFPIIVLNEPPKSEVLAFKPGAFFRREAFAVVYERASNRTFEALVDLRSESVISFKEVSGVQPQFMIEDFLLTQTIVRTDPQWQEAMRKRGITDFNNVQVDAWGAGFYGDGEGGLAVRMAKGISYYNAGTKNAYARPIEGVIAYVDLNKKRVFKLVDTGAVPVPKETGELDQKSIGRLRTPPKPLEIVQSQGPSFEVSGNEVRWQSWRFRYAMHPREGLVIYQVGYEDHGKLRSILYRASLSEMVVPYGDPQTGWFFRNAFDEGEYGIGKLALSLEPKTDFPANAVVFPAVYASDSGTPYELPRAVSIYERDGGVLWKHADYSSLPFIHNESRRSRQLVVEWFANVGNYEYGFNWIFDQDGTLEVEVLLTGIMAARGVSPEAEGMGHSEAHGHLVAEGVEAVHHQHFFNFRLDFDVDGAANSVTEMNTEPLPPGPSNPFGNSFTMRETVLAKEGDAKRQLNLPTARRWRVINTAVKNSLGQPVAYMLVPGENSLPFAQPSSSVRRRAGFINEHVWATPYDPTQIYSAGYYINQSKGGEGLPKWVGANRSIEDRDVVLWYTLGVTHIPRPEEWPVMVCHRAGFKLMPSGFFVKNPALDVPKPE